MDTCGNQISNEDAEFELIDRFWIDDGELDGLSPRTFLFWDLNFTIFLTEFYGAYHLKFSFIEEMKIGLR